MYLKRLELKGFKSFADKSILTLEPGITAVVGPNGSGKSNICDAILWVLGERNAKSLRGSIMEDVIFAGSVGRQPVEVAEVTLVLDNEDGTLPVDYSEVSVSRRMYRTGESDYLINGVLSRRLDVLDILHDSGLGTDTNSIISQGNLDSILQSKPIERRALIEEAAGVLKHKQRKIRSERKLEKMDHNLDRITDVMAEIERQIKPLRIKAKRAAAYDGLCEELSELTLLLAVDDLKNIKAKWDIATNDKEKLDAGVKDLRNQLDQAEGVQNNLRIKISAQSKDILEQTTKQRSLSDCIQKLDSYVLLLNEKAKNAGLTLSSAASPDAQNNSEKNALLARIEEITKELDNLKAEKSSLDERLKQAKEASDSASKLLYEKQKAHDELSGSLKSHQTQSHDLQKKLSSVKDSIAQAQGKIAALDDQIESLKKQEINLSADKTEAEKDAVNKQALYDDAKNTAIKLQDEVDKLSKKLEEAGNKKDEIQQQIMDANLQVYSYKKLIQSALDQESEAMKWLANNGAQIDSKIAKLADKLDVDEKCLPIVEALLGDFSESFIVSNDGVQRISEKRHTSAKDGNMYLISADGAASASAIAEKARKCAAKLGGYALVDSVKCAAGNVSEKEASKEEEVFSALANVVVFEKTDQALAASQDTSELCCVSMDGCVCNPLGEIMFCQPFGGESAANGADFSSSAGSSSAANSASGKTVLSYKKSLKKAQASFDKLSKQQEKNNAEYDSLKNELDSARDKNIEFKMELAKHAGELEISQRKLSSIEAEAQRCADRLRNSLNDRNILEEAYKASAPDVERYKHELEQLEQTINDQQAQLDEMNSALAEARQVSGKAAQEYNAIKLDSVTLNERINSKTSSLIVRNNQLENLLHKEDETKKLVMKSKVVRQRSQMMAEILSQTCASASALLARLDEDCGDIQSKASALQKELDVSDQACRDLRNQLDKKASELSDVSVELGRLEVQVQNAVDAIDSSNKISVDAALEMPELVDREDKEQTAFKIRRRIANMGTINPDAKEEYEAMKERFEFFDKQVKDLKSARQSLRKIDRIIDLRMKDDFLDTFEVVNDNFSEIFQVLFPGGSAKLVLENPDDVENSGVEVIAQPAGKKISKMTLMSGGEKSLVALCLLFAVYKTRSTPFYILDEVEAALDDSNLRRLIKYLEDLRETTQLILITHQRRTMEMADVLFGVSMKYDGVSKVVQQKIADRK